MDEEKFRRAVLESADRLVSQVLNHQHIPAVIYDLQLIGTKPLLSVRIAVDTGDILERGSQAITFGEKLTELIGGEWRSDEQYRRTEVT